TPLFFSLVRPRPRSTLFPYTTLFRSRVSSDEEGYPEKSSAHCAVKRVINCGKESCSAGLFMTAPQLDQRALDDMITFLMKAVSRSEEHTSELQSRGHLVCRLLLEKKK